MVWSGGWQVLWAAQEGRVGEERETWSKPPLLTPPLGSHLIPARLHSFTLARKPNAMPPLPRLLARRQCAAGLQAIANVAASIKAGYCNIGIAGVRASGLAWLGWVGGWGGCFLGAEGVSSECSAQAQQAVHALALGFCVPSAAAALWGRCTIACSALFDIAAPLPPPPPPPSSFHQGVESMTTDPLDWQGSNQPKVHEKQEAKDVLLPLGECGGWACCWAADGVGIEMK